MSSVFAACDAQRTIYELNGESHGCGWGAMGGTNVLLLLELPDYYTRKKMGREEKSLGENVVTIVVGSVVFVRSGVTRRTRRTVTCLPI